MPLFLAALTWSVRAMVFALGLRTTHDDVVHVWRRPGLLVRSLLAMYVLVPVAAVVMVKLVDLPRPTEVALLVLAISAGAPLVPRRILESGGDPAYVLSLAVTSSVLAIVSVPVSVTVISRFFGGHAGVDATAVARVVAHSFLLPLLAGLVMRFVWPSQARRLVTPLTNAAAGVFAVCALVLLAVSIPRVLEAGLSSFVALIVLTFVAVAVGHLLGGPRLEDRAALGVLCATRHIGLAMMIAVSVTTQAAWAAVAAYIVAALMVSTPYVTWVRRRLARQALPQARAGLS